MNPFDMPISSVGDLTKAKELNRNKESDSSLQKANLNKFQEEMAWQKELESEDPKFMKDVKISLIPKIEKVIYHLKDIIKNSSSSSIEKFNAEQELDRRITQYDRLLEKYKNND